MSKEALQAVIGKAVMDNEFREALFADPDKALEGYELTEEEVAALKTIDAETVEAFAGSLDERISKVFLQFDGGVGGFGPKAGGVRLGGEKT